MAVADARIKMGKTNRKHFDMATSKWNPSPKVKPEDIFKQVSSVPVLAKDSKGKTLVVFPEISVTTMFPPKDLDEPTTNIHRLEAEVDMMKEDASELPLEKGEVFVRSFLAQIKRRFKMLIRHINHLRDESVRLTAENEAIRAIAEKTDNDLWDIRMEFDALNGKMDSIMEVFEQWGVPVGTFSANPDVPFDTDEETTRENYVSGEDVAEMVKAEVKADREKSRQEKVAEHNARVTSRFGDAQRVTNSNAREIGAQAAKQMLLEEANTSRPISTSTWPSNPVVITPTKTATPLPPNDVKKSEKSNLRVTTYGRGTISHYCDMCKFSGQETGKVVTAIRCKNDKSKFANEIVYGLKDCDKYQSIHSTPSRISEIFGFDFPDNSPVSH